jgi:hypothetical protein
MAKGRQEYSRVDPVDLVTWTPVRMRTSSLGATLLSGLALSFANLVLLCGLALIWDPLGYVTVFTVVFSLWKLGGPLKAHFAEEMEESRLKGLRGEATRFEAGRGSKNRVSGLRAGVWICKEEEHNERRQEQRRVYGRDAPDPPVNYQLVIATSKQSGTTQRIAFSDGSALSWHAQSQLIQISADWSSETGSDSGDLDMLDGAARALVAMAHALEGQPRGMPIHSILANHHDFAQRAVLQAAHAGLVWGIFTTPEGPDLAHLYRMARDSDAPLANEFGRLTLRLTDAGQLWLECTDERQTAPRQTDRRTRMKSEPTPAASFVIHGNVSANNLNFAGGDIRDQTVTFHASSNDLLMALEAILARPDVPWHGEALTEIRKTIEEAVQQRDVRHPGLRRAVTKLVDVCEGLGVGIVGNTLFEALKNFVK